MKRILGFLFIFGGLYSFWQWVSIPVGVAPGLGQCFLFLGIFVCGISAACLLEPEQKKQGRYNNFHR